MDGIVLQLYVIGASGSLSGISAARRFLYTRDLEL
jgi:hypothetical protein